jgi:hypothetical protein
MADLADSVGQLINAEVSDSRRFAAYSRGETIDLFDLEQGTFDTSTVLGFPRAEAYLAGCIHLLPGYLQAGVAQLCETYS